MKNNFLVWAAIAAFFIFRSKDVEAAIQRIDRAVETGAEVLPGMLEEAEPIVLDSLENIDMTQHFTLAEFTQSATATRLGIDNSLPDSLMGNALDTLFMLENIRQYLSTLAGKDIPILISSGYRSPELNTAIRGSQKSDHLEAAAADWTAPSFGTSLEIAKVLEPVVNDLGIGQLINEFPGGKGWVHTSIRKPILSINRIITITAKGTTTGVQA
jgi:uncharacterized protein YcbK (DUF882 family)